MSCIFRNFPWLLKLSCIPVPLSLASLRSGRESSPLSKAKPSLHKTFAGVFGTLSYWLPPPPPALPSYGKETSNKPKSCHISPHPNLLKMSLPAPSHSSTTWGCCHRSRRTFLSLTPEVPFQSFRFLMLWHLCRCGRFREVTSLPIMGHRPLLLSSYFLSFTPKHPHV